MNQVLGPPGTAGTSTAASKGIPAPEEHVENVHGRVEAAPAPTASLFDGLLATLIVDFSLFGIG